MFPSETSKWVKSIYFTILLIFAEKYACFSQQNFGLNYWLQIRLFIQEIRAKLHSKKPYFVLFRRFTIKLGPYGKNFGLGHMVKILAFYSGVLPYSLKSRLFTITIRFFTIKPKPSRIFRSKIQLSSLKIRFLPKQLGFSR